MWMWLTGSSYAFSSRLLPSSFHSFCGPNTFRLLLSKITHTCAQRHTHTHRRAHIKMPDLFEFAQSGMHMKIIKNNTNCSRSKRACEWPQCLASFGRRTLFTKFHLNISFVLSVYCVLQWAPVSSAFRQVRVADKQDTTERQHGWEKLAKMLRQPDHNPIVQLQHGVQTWSVTWEEEEGPHMESLKPWTG